MSWSSHHTESQQYAAKAEVALRCLDLDKATEFYRFAAQAETLALYALDSSKVKTLGITAVSAASLWYKSKDFAQAKRIAQYWLETAKLPSFANEQLADILSAISRESNQEISSSLIRQELNSSISLHFGGDFASNNQISMRTLGRSLFYLQSAIDRAYLDIEHGELWKYAKMSKLGYEQAKFLVQPPRQGSYIASFSSDTEMGKRIINRLSIAIEPAVQRSITINSGNEQFAEGVDDFSIMAKIRKMQIAQNTLKPISYQDILRNPSEKIKRKYGDRSIVKEIDQLIVPIRSKKLGVSSIEITFVGDKVVRLFFDKIISSNFHKIVSCKTLGEPVIYLAKVRSLDNELLSGKIKNDVSNKTANIRFAEPEDFDKAIPFLKSKKTMEFVGCPIIEYDAFDPYAGDIYFLDLTEKGDESE